MCHVHCLHCKTELIEVTLANADLEIRCQQPQGQAYQVEAKMCPQCKVVVLFCGSPKQGRQP